MDTVVRLKQVIYWPNFMCGGGGGRIVLWCTVALNVTGTGGMKKAYKNMQLRFLWTYFSSMNFCTKILSVFYTK